MGLVAAWAARTTLRPTGCNDAAEADTFVRGPALSRSNSCLMRVASFVVLCISALGLAGRYGSCATAAGLFAVPQESTATQSQREGRQAEQRARQALLQLAANLATFYGCTERQDCYKLLLFGGMPVPSDTNEGLRAIAAKPTLHPLRRARARARAPGGRGGGAGALCGAMSAVWPPPGQCTCKVRNRMPGCYCCIQP